ncbi:PAS domain S-box protein [Methanoculleus sp. FWC-SCC1]|uniref:histidine kinase n=1 Tax=Methanoculleus frigidifontis TaxID=2584085 RepID=A0ABT8MDL3_9EURY|nr:PAS domain S-box protein [Methanoculleus sp. FWC-SCC1]MDN7025979.1 PAS domain S-box protein [Methanoculleus sp. FWC-SCC1]
MTKILLVDDEPALLEVGKLFIERSGAISVDTAPGGAEALEKLSSCCYDCIVSDYDMPGMDGIDLLKAVRKSDPGIPFIIFTGKGREEVVIDAINHGADFYLQKGGHPKAQFAELVHKIRQGVRRRITEKRNAHLKSVLHAIRDVHHLVASERDAASLMRKVAGLLVEARGYRHVWILLLDGEGRVQTAVEAGIGDTFRTFVAMLDRGEFPPCTREAIGRRGVVTVTNPAATCRDCPLVHSHPSISTMTTPIEGGGRLLGIFSATLPREFAADEEEQTLFCELGDDLGFALQANEAVIRRERAEAALKESEALYRAVFETTGTAMAILEDDRTIAYANREMLRFTGYSREELEGKVAWTSFIPEDDLDRMKEYHRLRRCMPGEAPQAYEFLFLNRQGERRPGFLMASMIPGTGRSVVSVLDITGLKEAETALHESEEKFRLLSESSLVGIYVIRDGRFVYVNPAMSAIFGYSQEEVLGLSPYDLVHPDDRASVSENIARRLAGEAGMKYAFRGITKAGEVRWFEVFGSVTVYDGRTAVFGTLIDVTAHRETRLALEESERKYRSFVNNTTSGIVVAQDGRIRYANPVITDHLGREPDGSDALSFDRYLHPDDLEHVAGMHRRRLAGEEVPENYVIRVIDRDGNTRMMAMNVSVIAWEGRPATLNFLTDVTREFALQEAQQEAEANYRTLMENAPVGIVVLYRGSVVYANRSVLALLGAGVPDELAARGLLEFVHPAHREAARALFAENYAGERQSGFSHVTMLGLDGREIEADVGTVPITYRGDAAVCILIRDVTEQKQNERSYRESRQQLALALDSANMGVWAVDLASGRQSMNARAAGIAGYSPGDFSGREEEWRSLVHPDDLGGVTEAIQSHLGGVSPFYDAEYRLRHKDGRYVWIHSAGRIAKRDRDGTPLLITGVMHDITGKKEAAEALHRSREDLLIKTTALDVSATAVTMMEPDGTIFYANDAFARMWGYAGRDEVIGTACILLRQADLRYPEEVRTFWETGSFVGVLEFARSDASPVTLHVSAAVFRDEGGEPLSLIASMIDISELETYRRSLERTNEKLNILSDITRHDILNQLAAIRGYLSFVRTDYPDDPAGYVAKVERAAETIEHQISFTRDYQHMGVAAPEWQRVDRLVEEALAEFDFGPIEVLVSTGPLEVYADPLLRKVIANLLDNALRHGGAVTRITISFTRAHDGGTLLFEDDGAGIPDAMKERIFLRGVGRNTGYGLFLVREILEITGISIRETGTEGAGARFEIAVPGAVCRTAR